MKRIILVFALSPVVFALAIQLVPVERTNPPVVSDIVAPAEVEELLRRSCYDCHSHETDWPWYAYVAPVSWRVASHVDHGRGHLNFSTWGTLNADRRRKLVEEIREEVEEGEMPLPDYLNLHEEARLSEEDRELLFRWTREWTPGESAEGGSAD